MISNQIPFIRMHSWIEKEKELGSAYPDRMVLATATKQGIPNSRVVAISEISEKGVLFFTQLRTKKVAEITENPRASMTLWLALQQRQVILNGLIKPLSQQENEVFWNKLPQERQLRFTTYAPTSNQPISSIEVLNTKFHVLTQKFKNTCLPMSEYYCGFRLIPQSFHFYTLGIQAFSEVISYMLCANQWKEQLLSP